MTALQAAPSIHHTAVLLRVGQCWETVRVSTTRATPESATQAQASAPEVAQDQGSLLRRCGAVRPGRRRPRPAPRPPAARSQPPTPSRPSPNGRPTVRETRPEGDQPEVAGDAGHEQRSAGGVEADQAGPGRLGERDGQEEERRRARPPRGGAGRPRRARRRRPRCWRRPRAPERGVARGLGRAVGAVADVGGGGQLTVLDGGAQRGDALLVLGGAGRRAERRTPGAGRLQPGGRAAPRRRPARGPRAGGAARERAARAIGDSLLWACACDPPRPGTEL